MILKLPRNWSSPTFFVLFLCSGPRRPDDFATQVEAYGHEAGLQIKCLCVDPKADSHWDLFKPECRTETADLLAKGRIIGALASPPCSTVTRVRYRLLHADSHGPRPLRSRESPSTCLPSWTPKENRPCLVGSLLALICIGLLGDIGSAGGWTCFEHPADPGKPTYPSFHRFDRS